MSQITIDDIEVHIKISKNRTALAIATLHICKEVIVHGFRVSKSNVMHPVLQEKIWIQPPSTGAPYWKKIIFIENKNLWNEIEAKIYDAYHELKLQTINDEDYVNVDDIPSTFNS